MHSTVDSLLLSWCIHCFLSYAFFHSIRPFHFTFYLTWLYTAYFCCLRFSGLQLVKKKTTNRTTQHIPSIVHRRNSKESDNNKEALKRNQAAKVSEGKPLTVIDVMIANQARKIAICAHAHAQSRTKDNKKKRRKKTKKKYTFGFLRYERIFIAVVPV